MTILDSAIAKIRHPPPRVLLPAPSQMGGGGGYVSRMEMSPLLHSTLV